MPTDPRASATPDFPVLAPGESWCPACGGEGSRDGRGDADEPKHVRCATCDGRATVAAVPAPLARVPHGHACVVLDGISDADLISVGLFARSWRAAHPGCRILITTCADPAGIGDGAGGSAYPRHHTVGADGAMIPIGGGNHAPDDDAGPDPRANREAYAGRGPCVDCGAPANAPGGIQCVACDRKTIDRT